MKEIIIINKKNIKPTEYFCIHCGQLRLNMAQRTTCGNCESDNLIHGAINELDKDSLLKMNSTQKSGITFGCILAIIISWSTNKSIIWAIIHGFFSWLYIIYFFIKH